MSSVVIIGLDAAGHTPADRRLFAYEDVNGEALEGIHANSRRAHAVPAR